MRTLSIGLFTYSTKPRGSVVHAAGLSEALAAAGHDVTLYALGKGEAFYRKVACAMEILAAAQAPSAMSELVRLRQQEIVTGFDALGRTHDVLHAQDCLTASALLERRTCLRALLVRTVHHVEAFSDAYLEACQRRSIREADALFSVSRATQHDVFALYGRGSALVRNGVSLRRFAGQERPPRLPVAQSERERRVFTGVSGTSRKDLGGCALRTILTVGGIEPRKNPLRALASVAPLLAEQRDVRWVIVGGQSFWDHSEHARAFDAALGALPLASAQRVERVGTLTDDELSALYTESAILFCPSEHEGFGLCVLEAMAAGTAVAVPGREPFTEYLDATCAAFVDPGSPSQMTATLRRLLESQEERQQLGAAGRERAQGWSWMRSAHRQAALYAFHLATRPARSSPQAHRQEMEITHA